MPTINLKLGQLSGELLKDIQRSKKGLNAGLRQAADQSVSILKELTPEDTGNMKNSWEVVVDSLNVEVVNNDPISGIINSGARPHPVSKAGQDAILSWAMRKGYDEKA